MTVQYSEIDGRYWLIDEDGDVIWFDSVLDAKSADQRINMRKAILEERKTVVNFLRKHGLEQPARAIESGQHFTKDA